MVQKAFPSPAQGPGRPDLGADSAGGEEPAVPPPDSPAPLRLLGILVRWRRLILLFTLCVVVFAVGISYLVAPTYQADAVVYPQTEGNDEMGGGNGGVASLRGLLGEPGANDNSNLIQAVLETRDLARAVLVHLGEIPPGEPRTEDEQRRIEDKVDRQSRDVSVSVLQTGALRIRARARTAERAATTANLFATLADSIIRDKTHVHAGATRAFLEQRIRDTQGELTRAQDRLMVFQQDSNAVSLEAQGEALVRVGSELQKEIVRLDAEIASKSGYLTEKNPEMQRLRHDRAALADASRRMAVSASPADPAPGAAAPSWNGGPGAGSEVLLPLQRLPSLGARYSDLLLAVEVQKQVLLYLNNRLEQVKLDESRSIPTLQILEQATRPPWRTSPRRKLIAVAGLFLGLAGGSLLAILLQMGQESLTPRDRDALRRMLEQLRWSRILRRDSASEF